MVMNKKFDSSGKRIEEWSIGCEMDMLRYGAVPDRYSTRMKAEGLSLSDILTMMAAEEQAQCRAYISKHKRD